MFNQIAIRRLRHIALATALLFSTAVQAGDPGYAGDGTYEDRGPKHVIARYVVDLGAVDLKKDETHEFKIGGLPGEEFVAGIVLDLPLPMGAEPKPKWAGDVNARIRLIDLATNKPVFEIDRDLTRFTWTNASPKPNTSFLYGRDGNRSIFTPAKGGKYKLVVEIRSEAKKTVPAFVFVTASGNKEEALRQDPLIRAANKLDSLLRK